MTEPSWREIAANLPVKGLPNAGLWTVGIPYVSGPRKLRIEATGQWGISSDRMYGPDGDRFSSDAVEKCLSSIVPRGSLIAKIGGGTSDRSGTIFPVGSLTTIDLNDPGLSNTNAVRGTLFLAMNDEPGKFGGHVGEIKVTIWEAA